MGRTREAEIWPESGWPGWEERREGPRGWKGMGPGRCVGWWGRHYRRSAAPARPQERGWGWAVFIWPAAALRQPCRSRRFLSARTRARMARAAGPHSSRTARVCSRTRGDEPWPRHLRGRVPRPRSTAWRRPPEPLDGDIMMCRMYIRLAILQQILAWSVRRESSPGGPSLACREVRRESRHSKRGAAEARNGQGAEAVAQTPQSRLARGAYRRG